MKSLLLFIFIGFSITAKGQQKIYNTKIDSAGKVEIKGGFTKILHVDTVFIGQIVINQSAQTEVFFLGSTTVQDTTGYYTTTFKFVPNLNPGTFNINVFISFDKPFVPWYVTEPPLPSRTNALVKGGVETHIFKMYGDKGDVNLPQQYTPDYKAIRIRGIVAADNIYISLKSKGKLFATIEGASEHAKK